MFDVFLGSFVQLVISLLHFINPQWHSHFFFCGVSFLKPKQNGNMLFNSSKCADLFLRLWQNAKTVSWAVAFKWSISDVKLKWNDISVTCIQSGSLDGAALLILSLNSSWTPPQSGRNSKYMWSEWWGCERTFKIRPFMLMMLFPCAVIYVVQAKEDF